MRLKIYFDNIMGGSSSKETQNKLDEILAIERAIANKQRISQNNINRKRNPNQGQGNSNQVVQNQGPTANISIQPNTPPTNNSQSPSNSKQSFKNKVKATRNSTLAITGSFTNKMKKKASFLGKGITERASSLGQQMKNKYAKPPVVPPNGTQQDVSTNPPVVSTNGTQQVVSTNGNPPVVSTNPQATGGRKQRTRKAKTSVVNKKSTDKKPKREKPVSKTKRGTPVSKTKRVKTPVSKPKKSRK